MKYDKNKLEFAKPAELDHMPVEVATALLTEPRSRITNRHRKLCKSAREKVFLSTSPIVHPQKLVKEGILEPMGFHYTAIAAKTAEHKLVVRAGHATLAQLDKWRSRCRTKRRAVQTQYQKVLSTEIPDNAHAAFKQRIKEQTLLLLSQRAAILDLAWDIFDSEISARAARCVNKKPINPNEIRRNNLLAAVLAEQRTS
jgi:hypothetical protein